MGLLDLLGSGLACCVCAPSGGGGLKTARFAPLKILFPFSPSAVIMQFPSLQRVFMEHWRKQYILDHFTGLEK